MIFPLSIISCILSLILAFRFARGNFSLKVILFGWVVELGILVLPIYNFSVEYSFKTDALVAFSLFALALGYVAVNKPSSNFEVVNFQEVSRSAIKLSLLLSCLGAIGQLLLLWDTLLKNGFNLAGIFANLSDVRQQLFEDLDNAKQVPLNAVIAGYLIAGSPISIISAVYFRKISSVLEPKTAHFIRYQVLLAVLNFVLLTMVSIFVLGARASIIYSILVFLIALYLLGWNPFKLKLLRTVALVFGISLVAILSASFTGARDISTTDSETLLAEIHRATYSDAIAETAKSSEEIGVLLLSLSYFAEPLPTLAYYLERPNTPGPFWGQYSFPLFSRMLSRAVGSFASDDWLGVRRLIFLPLESAGYYGNVWATWLRDLYVDFGYLGTVLFCFFYGMALAGSRNKFLKKRDVKYFWIEVLLAFIALFGAFTSTLWNSGIANPILASLLCIFLMKLRFRSGNSTVASDRSP